MTGRRLTSGLLAALSLPGLLSACASGGAAPVTSRPNVIVIVSDDQRPESLADMPRLQESLARAGVGFRRAFAPTPVCCPARASLYRGQYAHNHGVLAASGLRNSFYAFYSKGREASTLATWLDDAGYTTFFSGKYLNGYTGGTAKQAGIPRHYVPPGWDRWLAALAPFRYFGYEINDNGTGVLYGSEPEDYWTDVIAAQAVDFIRAAPEQGTPFFMFIAPFAPHGTPANEALPVPAPRHAAAFAGRQAPRGPAFDEAAIEDKPAWIRRRPRFSEEQVAAIDEEHRLRLRSLLAVDEMIGGIFAALDETGALDETFVFYASDNGFHLGEHRFASGKGTPFEESIRVPLLVAGPGVEPAVRDELVLLSDLAPTIAELAGLKPPEFVDGRSLVPLLEGGEVEDWRRGFLIQYWHGPFDGDATEVWRGVRTATHKYVEWRTRESDLYDLVADPNELNNLSSQPGAPVAALREWLEALSTCAGSSCRAIEQEPPVAALAAAGG